MGFGWGQSARRRGVIEEAPHLPSSVTGGETRSDPCGWNCSSLVAGGRGISNRNLLWQVALVSLKYLVSYFPCAFCFSDGSVFSWDCLLKHTTATTRAAAAFLIVIYFGKSHRFFEVFGFIFSVRILRFKRRRALLKLLTKTHHCDKASGRAISLLNNFSSWHSCP